MEKSVKANLKHRGFIQKNRPKDSGVFISTDLIMTLLKNKVWKTVTADKYFSEWIIERDKRCVRCHRSDKQLDNSHYWKRGDSSTRFDPKNCDALCRDCHTIWERQKNTEYREFKIKQLGRKEYDALEIRARTFMRREDAILQAMKFLKT